MMVKLPRLRGAAKKENKFYHAKECGCVCFRVGSKVKKVFNGRDPFNVGISIYRLLMSRVKRRLEGTGGKEKESNS